MNLENVKVGDKFMVWYKYRLQNLRPYYKVVTCERVTPTQCVIGGQKFHKKTGAGVGFHETLFEYSEDKYQQSINARKINKVLNIDFKGLSDDQMLRIYDIITEDR